MSLLSKGKDTGRYNGAFLSIFFLSVCAGNLFTGFMFMVTSGNSAVDSIAPVAAVNPRPPILMLLALVAVCAAGCAMLFFMPAPDDQNKTEPRTPLLERLKMTWSVTIERRTMYLHIYYVWIGIGIAFGWSRVPSLMPLYLVPWSMVMYGVGLFAGSMTLGRVFDQRGAMPLVLGNLVLAAIAYAIVLLVPAGTNFSECWPFFVVTLCHGGMEALLNVLCQSIILKYWEGARVACSFSIFRVVTGVSVSCAFFILQVMSTVPYIIMSSALLIAGCASIAYHELKVAPMVPSTVVVRPVTEADAEPQA
jgi:predicted MFS family arabinose efflux permease